MMKERNSNIELLRIISIILIVVSHYVTHNGVISSSLPIGFNRIFLEVLTLGNIGTILFVLITGFYLGKKEENIKFDKISKLYLQILFYSISIYLLFVILKLEPLSIKNLVKAIMPISFEQYWFASAYMILYIFHPFINKLLNSLSRKEHLTLIIIGLFIFSIMHTVTTKSYYGNELIQFIMFYSMGAYLSKYRDNIFREKNRINIIVLLISSILLICSVIFFDIVGTKINIFASNSTYLFSRTSILTIALSVSLFNIFVNKEIFYNKIINIISSCVFGVYLISDNNYIRSVLWQDILKNPNYVQSNYLIPHMLISVTLVFVTCLVIEYIRKNTLEKIYEKYFSNILKKFQKFIEYKFNKLYGFVKGD